MNLQIRPNTLNGTTTKIKTGCGNLYITVNIHENKIIEIFGRLGKSGGCAQCQINSICMLISGTLRSGGDINDIIKRLKGQRCHSPYRVGEEVVLSCSDAIAIVLENELTLLKEASNGG